MGQLLGDLKIEVAIVQIIMFRPRPAQFERTKSAANCLVLDNSVFSCNAFNEIGDSNANIDLKFESKSI